MFMTASEMRRCYKDTEKLCKENERLQKAIESSVAGTRFYDEEETPKVPAPRYETTAVSVQNCRTFEMALPYRRKFPTDRIVAHNFASARDEDGDVYIYSMAQEAALCRKSTLLPVLERDDIWKRRYASKWEEGNMLFTDDCLYTPGITIVMTDEDQPLQLPEEDWVEVDVLTCAAPILRYLSRSRAGEDSKKYSQLSDEDIFAIHMRRGRHLLSIAAANHADILIFGAYGCGPFRNPPEIVAEAYYNLLSEFAGQFREVGFAIYCVPQDMENYDVFKKVFGDR